MDKSERLYIQTSVKMSTGHIEYRGVLQQYTLLFHTYAWFALDFADSARGEYIPSSQALDGHVTRGEGIAAGNEAGMQSSEYPWACGTVPAKQLSYQTRQLYDSIYSLPLMSSPPKYPPLHAYDIHDSDQTSLAQRFDSLHDGKPPRPNCRCIRLTKKSRHV